MVILYAQRVFSLKFGLTKERLNIFICHKILEETKAKENFQPETFSNAIDLLAFDLNIRLCIFRWLKRS